MLYCTRLVFDNDIFFVRMISQYSAHIKMEKPNLYTPEQVHQVCNSQLEIKIKSGFPTRLDISETSFRQSYRGAINDILLRDHYNDGLPTLVEPRIPFFEQAQLLGIAIDPSVFYTPVCDRGREPYGIWVKVVGREDELVKQGLRFDKVAERLPAHLRPATPYEGINADIEVLLKHIFILFPGGIYKQIPGMVSGTGGVRTLALALERYLGVPRVSHYRTNFYDSLGGLLTAYK